MNDYDEDDNGGVDIPALIATLAGLGLGGYAGVRGAKKYMSGAKDRPVDAKLRNKLGDADKWGAEFSEKARAKMSKGGPKRQRGNDTGPEPKGTSISKTTINLVPSSLAGGGLGALLGGGVGYGGAKGIEALLNRYGSPLDEE